MFKRVVVRGILSPELPSASATRLSEMIRTPEVMAELGVKRILDADTDAEGHIGLELSESTELIVHPNRNFIISGSKVTVEGISRFEDWFLTVARQIEHVKPKTDIRVRTQASVQLDKQNQKILSAWLSSVEKSGGFPSGMQLRGALIGVSPNVNVATSPPDNVDILTAFNLRSDKIPASFISKLIEEGLQAVGRLWEVR